MWFFWTLTVAETRQDRNPVNRRGEVLGVSEDPRGKRAGFLSVAWGSALFNTEIPSLCVGWQEVWERWQEWEQRDGGCGERSVGQAKLHMIGAELSDREASKLWRRWSWGFSWMQMKNCGCWTNWEKGIWEVSHGLQIVGFSFSHRMKRQMTCYW